MVRRPLSFDTAPHNRLHSLLFVSLFIVLVIALSRNHLPPVLHLPGTPSSKTSCISPTVPHHVAPITVVITSYSTDTWRPRWIQSMISELLSPPLEQIVHLVILVWNNPDADVDARISALSSSGSFSDRFVIMRMERNSLNNRWMKVLRLIKTEHVLNFDDDIYVTHDAVQCMLNWAKLEPNRMIAPYMRRIEEPGHHYVLKELFNSEPYNMALPRVLMLPTAALQRYTNVSRYGHLHDYVDTQDAHCDDVLLNAIAQETLFTAPLRIALPPHSIVDFFSACFTKDPIRTGGLGLRKNRSSKRSECVRHILTDLNLGSMIQRQETATCSNQGHACELSQNAAPWLFRNLINPSKSANCSASSPSRQFLSWLRSIFVYP